MSLGESIRELRRAKDLTQEELGKLLEMTSQTVSKWERNESYPDAEMLPKLADALGVSLDRLYGRPVTRYRDAANAAKDWLLTLEGPERWEGTLRLGRILQTVLSGFWEMPGPSVTVEMYDAPDNLTGCCVQDEGITFSSRRESLPYLILLPEPETGWEPLLQEDNDAFWEALGKASVRGALKRLLRRELPGVFDRGWAKENAEELPTEALAGLEALGALSRIPAKIDGEDTTIYRCTPPPQLLMILLLGTMNNINDKGFSSFHRAAPLLRTREKGGAE